MSCTYPEWKGSGQNLHRGDGSKQRQCLKMSKANGKLSGGQTKMKQQVWRKKILTQTETFPLSAGTVDGLPPLLNTGPFLVCCNLATDLPGLLLEPNDTRAVGKLSKEC